MNITYVLPIGDVYPLTIYGADSITISIIYQRADNVLVDVCER